MLAIWEWFWPPNWGPVTVTGYKPTANVNARQAVSGDLHGGTADTANVNAKQRTSGRFKGGPGNTTSGGGRQRNKGTTGN